ncbi:MAG: hypothetical protein QM708_12200 [Propioniciclava sp.]|uniref:hypothetical protein n=1 Tax=Propioniciclava sp. TaxID=2038686 RepID=UPI0039E69584
MTGDGLEGGVVPAGDGSAVIHRTSQERITLRFDGDNVIDGTINARAMGQALQGAANLVQAVANTSTFDDHSAPEVRVAATEEGSFEIELIIQALGEWWAMSREVLVSDDAQAASALAGFVSVAVGAMKWARDKAGRRIKTKSINANGDVEAHLDDGTTLVAPPEVAEAAEEPKVQRAIKEVTAPLSYMGIQTLNIESMTVNISVSSDEARKIPDPEPEPDLTRKTEVYETWVTFDRPHFGGDRWGVVMASKKFRATIEDAEFLTRADHGNVSLGAYDEFKVRVREEPYLTGGGRRQNRRYIEQVYEHRQPKRDTDEPRLPTEEGGGG